MAEEVFMDYDEVQKLATQFGTYSSTLKDVSGKLEMGISSLASTFFLGSVGSMALQVFSQLIKPRVDEMTKKMAELQTDVEGAIKFLRDGDASGSARFR